MQQGDHRQQQADEDEAGQQDLEQCGGADDPVAQFGAVVAFDTGIGHGGDLSFESDRKYFTTVRFYCNKSEK
ncbi:MAG: hypothetical protein ACLUSS_03960 [Faecalibacterium sp.]